MHLPNWQEEHRVPGEELRVRTDHAEELLFPVGLELPPGGAIPIYLIGFDVPPHKELPIICTLPLRIRGLLPRPFLLLHTETARVRNNTAH